MLKNEKFGCSFPLTLEAKVRSRVELWMTADHFSPKPDVKAESVIPNIKLNQLKTDTIK